MFESWDFDSRRCLFPWKRQSEAERKPVSSALGASDSEGERVDCTLLSGGLSPRPSLLWASREGWNYLGIDAGFSFNPQL